MEFRLRPWGADGDLVALLGEQGAAEFRALFDAFPDPVGVLWALRDESGTIVDFAFGYGNLAMLAGFRLPSATPDRYTLLEQHPDTPPSPEVLRQLRASAVRARELIDGVLAYARSGELRRERVSLAQVMAEVSEDLRPALDAHAVLVVGGLPHVDADPRQLRRVLQNLLSNALRFRRGDSVRIEVTSLGDAREWVVSVRDDGVGVPPEHTGRIFGMFARLDPSADGIGLGLAVCRRVVEAHGGRIWVEPADDGGSVFRFTLPR